MAVYIQIRSAAGDSSSNFEDGFTNFIKNKNLSVEFLHLGKNRKKILSKLADSGYSFKGSGFDVNGYDFMFEKKTNIYLKFKTKYFTPSIKKYIKTS
tara:strand:+ start:442 stop:732 length:291 start_codon:yes stop_codon:yes gene_type:complete